jgi:hypothetical protein
MTIRVATLSDMKRLLLTVFCLILSLSLSGCSSKAVEVSAPDDSVVQVDPNDESIVNWLSECDNPGEISPDGKYICDGHGAFYWLKRSEESSTPKPKSEESSTPKPKIVSIPTTEAGLRTAIGKCADLVIDPIDAKSSDPRVADRISANVADCINTKYPQFYCGPIAMDDGSTGSLGDQVCTWEDYQIQGIRIIMTDEYTDAMRAAGSPYYP